MHAVPLALGTAEQLSSHLTGQQSLTEGTPGRGEAWTLYPATLLPPLQQPPRMLSPLLGRDMGGDQSTMVMTPWTGPNPAKPRVKPFVLCPQIIM